MPHKPRIPVRRSDTVTGIPDTLIHGALSTGAVGPSSMHHTPQAPKKPAYTTPIVNHGDTSCAVCMCMIEGVCRNELSTHYRLRVGGPQLAQGCEEGIATSSTNQGYSDDDGTTQQPRTV